MEMWVWWALVSLVLLVLVDYARSYLQLRATGVARFTLGYPLVYRMPYFLLHLDRLYDDLIATMKDVPGHVLATKRSPFAPVALISANAAVNKYILERPDQYIKGPEMTSSLAPLLGGGIFNANGDRWLNQRKVASPMFAKREIKDMINVFVAHFEASTKEHLMQHLGEPVEMQTLFSAYTLESFVDICFGVEMESASSDFATAFNDAQAASLQRFVLNPFWKIPWLGGKFPFVGTLQRSVDTLDAMIYGLIESRRSDIDSRQDLLSRYLALQHAQQQQGLAPGELVINDKYIRDIVLNFILAGRDTTAQTCLWATYLLSLPENRVVRDKVTAELDAIGEYISYETLQSLPYTERFIYETLRLYPPVPGDPKTAVRDDVLPGGYRVKAGYVVLWSQNVMGRSEAFFHRPLECLPDRWLGPEFNGGKEIKLWSGAFIPFQDGGRRVCMGKEMALLEVKATLACMVRSRLEFEVAPNQAVKRAPNITICARHGIQMIPSVRK